MTIPALLILKNLDEDDKGICKNFFPPMFEKEPVGDKPEEAKEDNGGRKSIGGSSPN